MGVALSNKELLNAIKMAVKGIISPDTLGDSLLTAAQFDRFVRAMQEKTVVLPEARYIDMDSEKVNIDRIAFSGRVLKSGTDDSGNHRNLDEDDFSEPNTSTNQLIAKELQAIVGIYDKTLRRNIEKGDFENTLVDLLGEAAGRDLEEWGLLARTSTNPSDDLLLSLTDGWMERAENKIYGGGTESDFDVDADDWPVNLFDMMLEAIPKKYLGDRTQWRFYVDWAVEKAYRDYLKERGTSLGDSALTSNVDLVYDGIRVQYAPMLERSASVSDGGVGRVATLQHPDNMAWGVFHEVNIEPEREAKKRRTDFVLTFEGDANYEDENAAVAAYIDAEDGDF